MTEYSSSTPAPHSAFWKPLPCPKSLVARAAELEMPAMALLDHDNISGAVRFHMAAKKAGIRAHIGAEITGADGHRYPLLAENRTGYQNLCRLITRMKLRATKGEGAATREDFAEFSEGLVLLTGGDDGPLDFTPGCMDRLLRIFGQKNIYAELQRHYDRAEEARNQAVIDIRPRTRPPDRGHQRRSHATPRRARSARTCSPRCATKSRSTEAGPPAGAQLRAPPETRSRDGAALCRSARSHRQHARAVRSGSNSRSPISAMNFRDIPCPPAKP